MFNPALMAALAPFILGFTKASVVRRGFFPSLLLPNYPVPHPDPSFAANQVQQPPPPTVSAVPPLGPSAQVALGHNPECGWWEDWECYRKYWDDNQYCHPYDRHCYRDCDDYDDYWGHCKSYDQNYGKCYDRCYYNDDNCNKYQDCHEQDDECYRKKRREDYCDPYSYDNKCRDEHEPPKDYCRPWDWACHERKHPHDDYKCQPYKDKDCYPDVPEYPEYPQYPEHPKYPEYPDHPEYPDQPDQPEYPEYPDHPEVPKYPDEGDDDDRPHPEPRHNVVVKFFGAKTGYEMKIWPNGEEHYTEMNREVVYSLKYYTLTDEYDVRCLPMKNYFPWTPLRIEEYTEQRQEENGWKIRTITLDRPQPVEVIRCDYP